MTEPWNTRVRRIRRRLRKAGQSVALLLAATLSLILTPILIPVALAIHTVGERRKRRVAEGTRCIRCGSILGDASVRLADAEWREHMEELRRANPGVRFRIHRTLHAVCARCGARYSYLEAERRFVLEVS